MVHSALNGCYIVALGSFSAEWNQQNIKKWVVRASGQVEPRVTDNTTHLVTTTKEWERKGTVVQDATKRIADGQELYIVSYDWLDDCLQSKSRKREKKYRIFDGKGDRTGAGGAADEPRSAAGLMKQLYEESTELTPAAKKNLEQQQAVAQELERAKEAEKMKMFQETRMSLPEQALVFKKGAQKGKQLLLSDNYHIYQDSTAFTYDITLTKVDTRHNTNERYSLVIFESNTVPHTYAFCTQFSGTKIPTQSNTIISVGSNWFTTFRAFKAAFKEKTGIEWDDRVTVAEQRHARDKATKAQSNLAGTYGGEQLGVSPRTVEDLNAAPFQYHPPNYGPRGEFEDMRHAQKKQPHAQSQQQSSHSSDNGSAGMPGGDREEFFMSGANGDAFQQARSPTPLVMGEFGPGDVAKLKAAMEPKDPDGTVNEEPLQPYGEPFNFGKDYDWGMGGGGALSLNGTDSGIADGGAFKTGLDFGFGENTFNEVIGGGFGHSAGQPMDLTQVSNDARDNATQMSQVEDNADTFNADPPSIGLGGSKLGKRRANATEQPFEKRQKRSNGEVI